VDREIRTLGSRHPGWFTGRGSFERLASSLEFTFGEDYTNQIILLIKDAEGRISYRSPYWPVGITFGQFALQLEAGNHSGAPTLLATNAAVVDSPAPDANPSHSGWGRGMGLGRGGPPSVIFNKTPKFFTAVVAEAKWRIGVLGNDDVTLVIGLNQQEVEHELNHLRDAFVFTLPVALLLVGLGGWIVAGRALRPLKTIADTAEHITARGLDQRIPDSGDSPEASRVVQVLNRMMDRLEASFRQATRFSADASHELKTPLTVMQGELENALQAAAPGSAEQQLFTNLLEETQRLSAITRSLLLLAQADAGQLKLTLAPVDLSTELDGMIEDARVLAEGLRLTFDVQLAPQLFVEADRTLLHTAIFNLIRNAIKYNEPDGRIEIRLASDSDEIVFEIGNTGPGIPLADQKKIFDRFYRAGPARSPRTDGLGLGLSLAREIIRAHGGELKLKESRAGRTCFELRLNRRP
jgi:heavy metal sensor kinase